MTAHELARKLLEGPDLIVVFDANVGAYDDQAPETVDTIEPKELYQWDWSSLFTNQKKPEQWSELHYEPPGSKALTVRTVQALRLR